MKPIFPYILILIMSFNMRVSAEETYIIKNNVLDTFVRNEREIDHFTQNVFSNWENETFDVFEKVKNPKGIAIDLGASIGTTSIWLSNNFHHLVVVDGDLESIRLLKLNLNASKCTNITIVDRPIDQISRPALFGSRGDPLNQSTLYSKDTVDNASDFITKSITFKQLLYDAIFSKNNLNNHEISFIKCDIEGGEEAIFEDVMHFAYYNKCPVYMSFHLDWWKSKKISDFDYLFKYFDVENRLISNVSEHLNSHPFDSLLFFPKKDAGQLIKENIPAVVISYNQYTYLKQIISQLEKYTKDIVVIDNASTYEPLLSYYENDFKYTLLKQNVNQGHMVYAENWVRKIMGDVFIITDPDLEFNENLPDDFLHQLIDISNYFQSERVGFALLIDADDIREDAILRYPFGNYTIKEWEIQFWKNRCFYEPNRNLELYFAPIDTTFCLLNYKYSRSPSIRVAGDFTCKHIPWHKDYLKNFQPGEFEQYLQNNISTSWFGPRANTSKVSGEKNLG